MSQHRLVTRTRLAHLIGMVAMGSLVFAGQAGDRPVNGTIWAANRGNHTIRGFDAGTGAVVTTVAMAAIRNPATLRVPRENSTSPRNSARPPPLPSLTRRLVSSFTA